MDTITRDNLQEIFDKAGAKRRSGLISSEKYISFMNTVEHYNEDIKGYITSNMRGRLDGDNPRRLGVFAESIMKGSISQHEEANWWVQKYAHLHFDGTPFTLEDNGVDNRGFVIIVSKNRPEFKEPDYVLKSKTHPDRLLEYKDCPVSYKGTYKETDLKNQKAHILTIHRFSFKDPRRAFYTLISPDTANRMLNELTVRKYKEIGYKLGVQIDDYGGNNGIGKFEDYLKKYTINN